MDRWNKAGQKEVIVSRLGLRFFFRKYDFVSYVRVAYMPPEGSTRRLRILHTHIYMYRFVQSTTDVVMSLIIEGVDTMRERDVLNLAGQENWTWLSIIGFPGGISVLTELWNKYIGR